MRWNVYYVINSKEERLNTCITYTHTYIHTFKCTHIFIPFFPLSRASFFLCIFYNNAEHKFKPCTRTLATWIYSNIAHEEVELLFIIKTNQFLHNLCTNNDAKKLNCIFEASSPLKCYTWKSALFFMNSTYKININYIF